jgi:DNA-binding CsgD family transcriptional regulator
MFIEYFSYLATFIATTGLAVIGTLVSYQCFQRMKKPVLQILLYQQIFLFSFFIYGIWGNLAIREIIADIDLSAELTSKLAFYVPVLGTPFLIVSWYMLLKFGFNLNNYKIPKPAVFAYFIGFISTLLLLTFAIQNNYIQLPGKPDTSIIWALAGFNFIVHAVLILPFINPRKSVNAPFPKKELQKTFFIYFSGVALYTFLLFFFDVFGFVSTNLALLAMFGASVVFPVRLKYLAHENSTETKNMDFSSFCTTYEISKREAEIVREICTGKTNKAIAEKLFITLQTVKDHTHRIYTKTDVKSRVQLANLVREKTGQNDF